MQLPASSVAGSIADIENIISRPVDEFELKGKDELFDLCRKLSLSCGQERNAVDWWGQEYKFPKKKLKGTSLKAILDAIALRHPGYHWRIYGKTIVVEPMVRLAESPLHRKVSKFSLHKQNLYRAPRQAAKAAGVKFLGGFAQTGVYAREEDARIDRSYRRQIDVELSDATLQEILCAIVATHGSSYWLFIHGAPGDAVDPDSVSFEAY